MRKRRARLTVENVCESVVRHLHPNASRKNEINVTTYKSNAGISQVARILRNLAAWYKIALQAMALHSLFKHRISNSSKMIKIVSFLAFIAVASAGVVPAAPLVHAAPAVAVAAVPAPIITAKSSQVVARKYNTFAAAPVLPYTAAAIAAPTFAHAPAFTAPLTYAPLRYTLAAHPAAPLVVAP
ncbi:hypothetical protein KM043_011494 [Ampulex compressa]|nr:hypothetical protein KM043_011494 [Ampulex compressa]